MDRRKPILVNIGEREVDETLRRAAAEHGARVFAKPRLADVLNIDRSGLSDTEYRYALQAHFDFVIADESSGRAHFAVEFDEPYHQTSRDAQRRDAMKNDICKRLGLPLLRIDADYLQTVRGTKLLAWLVHVWFLAQAFDAEQEAGRIHWDEPFNPWAVYEHDGKGRMVAKYDLAGEARARLWKARDGDRCKLPGYIFRTTDEAGEAYATLALTDDDDRWLISYVRLRGFTFAVGVSPGELAADVALVAVADKLEEYERGAAVAAGRDEFEAVSRNAHLGSGWSFSMSG